ncbi:MULTISPECIES: YjjG family noncanonical pyrimidine nucleotidase [Galbibacter]|uniref:HAD hydrolase, subfamily IA n=1 Tax=Galbibacter orientalis DSM 19592 TaxID=926559 RepID=I3C898_9FLAO|nr:YjjG family noncanonical pyrimidine nucleotidase [Galbibacter orientalis]EIJ39841.1 HAD hydrolase, subfamily IA [Galbibacter orientalis DSM 19592]
MILKNEGITDVFFDLDHTLWDFEKNSELTYKKIFSENKLEIDLVDFFKLYVPYNIELWKLYQEDKISKEDLRYKRLKTIFDQLNIKVDEEMIHKLSDDYIENLATFNHLFVDTIEILDYLKPNYKLHIITNGFAEVQLKKLKNSKIDHYFQVIMDSETAGVKKPNAIIFEKALEQANAKPEVSVMIGDSYEADILGAKNIGMHTLFYTPKEDYVKVKSHKINKLKQIKNYL